MDPNKFGEVKINPLESTNKKWLISLVHPFQRRFLIYYKWGINFAFKLVLTRNIQYMNTLKI